MLSFLSIIAVMLVLGTEGYVLSGIILNTRGERLLRCLLGYPLGALLNALVFFGLNSVDISFSALSVGILHLIVLSCLCVASRLCVGDRTSVDCALFPISLLRSRVSRPLLIITVTLIALTVIPSILYAFFIHSYYWDIFTNWAMQSHQFLEAGKFLTTDIAKPHYPVLLHSLQMSVMLLTGWRDQSANISTLILSLTLFGSLFLLLSRIYNQTCALMTLALMLALPMVSIHLQQGYADIHAGLYLLVSILLLEPALKKADNRMLLLSGLCAAAAAWTKMEGLYLGVIPWLCVVLFQGRKILPVQSLLWSCLPVLLIAGLWPLHLLWNGLLLTPNGLHLGVHIGDAPIIIRKLFVFGSFGVHWYAIPLSLATLLIFRLRSHTPSNRMILWGVCVVIFLVCLYLGTDEVIWLRQRTAFTRAMIFPTLLLTQALSIRFYDLWNRRAAADDVDLDELDRSTFRTVAREER